MYLPIISIWKKILDLHFQSFNDSRCLVRTKTKNKDRDWHNRNQMLGENKKLRSACYVIVRLFIWSTQTHKWRHKTVFFIFITIQSISHRLLLWPTERITNYFSSDFCFWSVWDLHTLDIILLLWLTRYYFHFRHITTPNIITTPDIYVHISPLLIYHLTKYYVCSK